MYIYMYSILSSYNYLLLSFEPFTIYIKMCTTSRKSLKSHKSLKCDNTQKLFRP